LGPTTHTQSQPYLALPPPRFNTAHHRRQEQIDAGASEIILIWGMYHV
jgi:hypothetical protein